MIYYEVFNNQSKNSREKGKRPPMNLMTSKEASLRRKDGERDLSLDGWVYSSAPPHLVTTSFLSIRSWEWPSHWFWILGWRVSSIQWSSPRILPSTVIQHPGRIKGLPIHWRSTFFLDKHSFLSSIGILNTCIHKCYGSILPKRTLITTSRQISFLLLPKNAFIPLYSPRSIMLRV